MSKTPSFHVGIVGATGAVGQELLQLLQERQFPLAGLRLFASARSAGKTVSFGGRALPVEEAKPGVFADLDLAFFAAGGPVTRALAPDAVKAGCLVIDKSSAFRLDPAVPLVIPEINPEALRTHAGIIANPNCSTAVTLMGLWPLHQRFGLKRYFVVHLPVRLRHRRRRREGARIAGPGACPRPGTDRGRSIPTRSPST